MIVSGKTKKNVNMEMLLLTENGIVVHQVVRPNEGQQIDRKKTFCHLEKFSLNAQKMTTVSLQQQLVDAR